MKTRRTFLKTSAAALAVAAARPLFAWQGANNRIRMAVIGCGNRAGRVFDSFTRIGGTDCQLVAAARSQQGPAGSVDDAGPPDLQARHRDDYRRSSIARTSTRSLSAPPTTRTVRSCVDALPPARTSTARSRPRTDAARQRDARRLQEGQAGRSDRHAPAQLGSFHRGQEDRGLRRPGNDYSRVHRAARQLRAREGGGAAGAGGSRLGLWQLDAPKRPFKPSRLAFRGWYAYGSGLIGDWGAHHVDVAHWFMNADTKVPLRTTAIGAFLAVPDVDPEEVPDSFSISWLYDNFLMTFANGEVYMADGIEKWGVFFIGNRGSLQVNRQGYAVRPVVPHVIRKQGPPPPPTAGGARSGREARRSLPGGPGGARGGGRGGVAAGRRRRSSRDRSRRCTSTRAAPSRRTIRSTSTRGTSSTA